MEQNNLKIWEQVKSVDKEYLDTIKGGRLNGKSSIKPIWRIQKLTEIFGTVGIGWYYNITDKRFEKGANDEVSVFVDIELFVKQDNEWSKPINGTGGSTYVAKEKNGLYTSDEAIKMATTDAIGVACKNLGFAADMYSGGATGDDDKYSIKKSDQSFHDILVIKDRINELVTLKLKEFNGLDEVAKQIGLNAKQFQQYMLMCDQIFAFEQKLKKVKKI